MAKVHINLSLDSDIYELSKTMNLNLSEEFEQWIRIRMNQYNKDEEQAKVNTELEIAKHIAEIKKLQTQAEMEKEQKDKEDRETKFIDYTIDNINSIELSIESNKGKSIEELIDDSKIHGIQFIFKKKFNKTLDYLQAKELILNRIKERGL